MFGQGWFALLGLCQPLRDVGLKAKGMLPCITEISHFNLQPFQGLVTGKFTHPETSFFFSFLFFFPRHQCAAHYITRIRTNPFIPENNANPPNCNWKM